MNAILTILAIIGLTLTVSAQEKLPEGIWQNTTDADHSWQVKNNEIATRYQGKVLDTEMYEITKKSCDKDYNPTDQNHLFLEWAGVCYEIVLINETTIHIITTLKTSDPVLIFKKE